MMQEKDIPTSLLDALRSARRVAALTGAGVSAESGVPTFRDAQTGLWAQYSPKELATPKAFTEQPELLWRWYTWRRELVASAKPNPAHYALAELERRVPHFTLITQNVDGLHQQAGSGSIVELHGNLQHTRCFQEGIRVDQWEDTGDVPPRCPSCRGLLRPGVVWFGESLPEAELKAAWRAAEKADVFFTIGTSAIVQPAASLPLTASEHGAVVVEVNPDRTPLTYLADYVLQGPAGEILPELLRKTWS